MHQALDPSFIASLSLHDPDHFHIQLGQTEHRVNLVNAWQIKEGDQVLEIGCGQGDCTAVLAAAVGESGKVVAIDPAEPEYGSPYTLAQAQGHLIREGSPLRTRLTFLRQTAQEHLEEDKATIHDVAILAHCIWYFSSPSSLLDTFRALSTRTRRICLAEWSLTATKAAAVPHLLAALTQASLECRKLVTVSNIRTVLSPQGIVQIAKEAGLEMTSESVIESPIGMLDGHWEVGEVVSKGFGDSIAKTVQNEREQAVVEALRDAVIASKSNLNGEKIRAMDVWVGCFQKALSED
ncbi:hypothetical protein HYDPIDRAFT_116718 [Hydnomerulius pinastri MD-312]|uniref:Methyltransferase domain-containing protein n=1 Tax=Hydnomerulius pinastri MD-312 TaxID=994086 RepID=A0A0C9WBH9_9AGAM|nr:hypothetical protein HYDPIDRAFT_116718 [Hydnomerulius pinastri MD-312]